MKYQWIIFFWLLPLLAWGADGWSAREREYIAAHPSITLGVIDNHPPMSFKHKETQVGILPDIVALLGRYTPFKIEAAYLPIGEVVAKSQSGEIEGFIGQPSTEREKSLRFTHPLHSFPYALFSKTPQTCTSMRELRGKRIAVLKDFAAHSILQEALKGEAETIAYGSFIEAMEGIMRDEADLYLDHMQAGVYQLKQWGVSQVQLACIFKESPQTFSIGVKKDQEILFSILNKSVAKIPTSEIEGIFFRWVYEGVGGFEKRLALTRAEEEFAERFPEITVLGDGNLPPYSWMDGEGRARGILPEVLEALSQKMGVKLSPKLLPYAKLTEELCLSKAKVATLVDVLDCKVKPQDYLHTLPYTRIPLASFALKENLKRLERVFALKGRRIVFLEGVLPSSLPSIHEDNHFLFAKDYQEAFSLLLSKEADLFVDAYYPVLALSQQMGLREVEFFRLLPENYRGDFLVHESLSPLKGMIDRALLEMESSGEMQGILTRHIGILETEELDITPQERQWLEEHPVIKIGAERDFPPFEWIDPESGKHLGVAPEMLAKVQKLLGVKLELESGKDWPRLMKDLEEGRLDMLSTIIRTPARENRFLFSAPYLSFPLVIVGHDERRGFIENLSALKRSKVGVVKGYYTEELLRRSGVEIEVMTYANAKEGMKALVDRRIDFFLENLPTINYIIAQEGYSGAKLLGRIDQDFSLTFGFYKEHPELASLIDKAIAAIPEKEKQEIYNRWSKFDIAPKTNWKMIVQILSIALLFVLFMLFVNRNLSREVRRRREVEAELLKAKELAESANRAKSEFLSNMSHEIRTPLNSILGFAEILQHSSLGIKEQRYVENILKSGKVLMDIINDILDLSRVEAGKMLIQKHPVELEALVREVYGLFLMKAKEKNLDLDLVIDERLPKILVIDGTRVRQILFNLVGNAIKFTHKGYVRISVERGERESEGGIELVLRIKDSGIGIAQADSSKIFEAFEQQSGQDNRLYGGTGLGLAICQRLARLMDGEISLVSQEGLGSEFIVSLQGVIAGVVDQPLERISPSYRFGSEWVLVVDDVEENLELTSALLEAFGLQVATAKDGEEAVEIAQNLEPKLILMDLRMPKMDGFEATKEMRKLKALRSTPIVALTASLIEKGKMEAHQDLFDEIWQKPLPLQTLQALLLRYFTPVETQEDSMEVKPSLAVLASLSSTHQTFLLELIRSYFTKGSLEEAKAFASYLHALAKEGNDALEGLSKEILEWVEGFEIDTLEKRFREMERFLEGEKE